MVSKKGNWYYLRSLGYSKSSASKGAPAFVYNCGHN